MVVDVPQAAPVGLGLRLGNSVIDRPRLLLHLPGQGQAVDQISNVSRRGVVVMLVAVLMVATMPMMMVMAVLMLLLTPDGHTHVSTRNAAGFGGGGNHLHPGQSQMVHRL